jgi:hypothetical protein
VLALSFHAVFEGLAVGLEEKQEDVWTLFAGNSTHICSTYTCSTLNFSIWISVAVELNGVEYRIAELLKPCNYSKENNQDRSF